MKNNLLLLFTCILFNAVLLVMGMDGGEMVSRIPNLVSELYAHCLDDWLKGQLKRHCMDYKETNADHENLEGQLCGENCFHHCVKDLKKRKEKRGEEITGTLGLAYRCGTCESAVNYIIWCESGRIYNNPSQVIKMKNKDGWKEEKILVHSSVLKPIESYVTDCFGNYGVTMQCTRSALERTKISKQQRNLDLIVSNFEKPVYHDIGHCIDLPFVANQKGGNILRECYCRVYSAAEPIIALHRSHYNPSSGLMKTRSWLYSMQDKKDVGIEQVSDDFVVACGGTGYPVVRWSKGAITVQGDVKGENVEKYECLDVFQSLPEKVHLHTNEKDVWFVTEELEKFRLTCIDFQAKKILMTEMMQLPRSRVLPCEQMKPFRLLEDIDDQKIILHYEKFYCTHDSHLSFTMHSGFWAVSKALDELTMSPEGIIPVEEYKTLRGKQAWGQALYPGISTIIRPRYQCSSLPINWKFNGLSCDFLPRTYDVASGIIVGERRGTSREMDAIAIIRTLPANLSIAEWLLFKAICAYVIRFRNNYYIMQFGWRFGKQCCQESVHPLCGVVDRVITEPHRAAQFKTIINSNIKARKKISSDTEYKPWALQDILLGTAILGSVGFVGVCISSLYAFITENKTLLQTSFVTGIASWLIGIGSFIKMIAMHNREMAEASSAFQLNEGNTRFATTLEIIPKKRT
jgi:hypothetical protein